MPHLKRAALAVLLLALIPAPDAGAQAQRQPARPAVNGGGTATPLRLPPAQARPPATRRNAPAPVRRYSAPRSCSRWSPRRSRRMTSS